MKNFVIAAACLAVSMGFMSCGGAHGDDPGHSYMPDMYYSRAYETYGYNNVGGERDTLKNRGINYNGLPVVGTIARGEAPSYHLTNDSAGLSAANSIQNPLKGQGAPAMMTEAERLYLVYCGICHGSKLDGNGPLWNGGEGPYPSAPRNLLDDYTKNLTDGHIFHVITFGKGAMGSYASQLNTEQRWWVINYIRAKQGGGAAATDSTAANPATGTTPTDSTKAK